MKKQPSPTPSPTLAAAELTDERPLPIEEHGCSTGACPHTNWLDCVETLDRDYGIERKPTAPREFWINPKNWQVYFVPLEGRIHVREVKKL